MNVSLTPLLERSVADSVASGRYRSASEVVRAALRLLEKDEKILLHDPKPPLQTMRGDGHGK
jgi:antitoxin ParD1/3/4